jgi:DNA polymerase III subunit epsilon
MLPLRTVRQDGCRCNRAFTPSGGRRITRRLELLEQPIRTAEFLAIDTETNGLGGDDCELTEVGAVLVGGGELHDRWSSLVRTNLPLRRGIQRFTGITQQMVDGAPPAENVLPELEQQLRGRVMVAHNAPFDRRVLRQAFDRGGLEWPNPPVICTAALARTMLPLQRERRLGALADALGIEVRVAHRALADAETCARVLCALFPRLCVNAATVGDALAVLKPRRPSRPKPPKAPRRSGRPVHDHALPQLDFKELPKDPGVYLFRDAAGNPLYVGKSLSIRSRARAHFAPSTPRADWTAHATLVDYRATSSELGALVLENRLIKALRPPGNIRLRARDERLVYIRCRLDIPFPILEVASEPASGHAVTIGPLRGRRLATELVEQLDSLFGLRHCGRTLPRRDHPSAYGQMGRCLSPCLGDLDPNLYRRRLDEALGVFRGAGDSGPRLIAHVRSQMRAAAAEQQYERAAWLRRRASRLTKIVDRLEGTLEATHARPRLLIAAHPTAPRGDGFWIVGGRLVAWGPMTTAPDALRERTRVALSHTTRAGELGVHVPPDEVDEIRILGNYLAAHPDAPQLTLEEPPSSDALGRFVSDAGVTESAERQLDDLAGHTGADGHAGSGWRLTADQRERNRTKPRRQRGARDASDSATLRFDLIP